MAHIVVSTPMYGGLCCGGFSEALLGLQELLRKEGHAMDFAYITNESLVQRARNTLAWFFLEKTQGTHMMFIDADIEFNPEDVLKMINADKDLIGGVYPKKGINWNDIKKALELNLEEPERFSGNFVFRPIKSEEKVVFNEPLETDLIGTGFMLIKRNVFERLKEYVGSYVSNNDTIDRHSVTYNFFQVPVENNELLSEDFFFCRAFRRIGGQVYSAPWANFVHNGNYRFRGSFIEHVKLSAGHYSQNKE